MMKKRIWALLLALALCMCLAAAAGAEGDGWTLTGDTLTVTSDTPMAPEHYYAGEGYAWFSSRESVKHVVIQSGVTLIGDYAFRQFPNLQSVTIADTVTKIGKYAFSMVSKLSGVVIPASVKTVGEFAFFNCTGLERVEILGSVDMIENQAFGGCTSLKRFVYEGTNNPGSQYAFFKANAPSEVIVTKNYDSTKTTFCGIPVVRSSIAFDFIKDNHYSSDQDAAEVEFELTGLEAGRITLYVDGQKTGTTWTQYANANKEFHSWVKLKELNLSAGAHKAYVVFDPDGDTLSSVTSSEVSFTWDVYHTVTVSANPAAGGSAKVSDAKSGYKKDEPIVLIATTNDGFTFDGWYEGNTRVSTSGTYTTNVSRNLVLEARWAGKDYTITFDTDGGSAVAAITQACGTEVTAPADPQKTGYAFAGWKPALPQTMPAGGLEVKAKWTANTYTITFDTDGGSAVAGITQAYGTEAAAPADPEKKGYLFAGWADENGNTVTFPLTMPLDGMKLTALWESEKAIAALPGTGDGTNIALWALLALASGMALLGTKKRRNA